MSPAMTREERQLSQFSAIKCEIEPGFAVVTLSRPPVNAISPRLTEELRTCFEVLGTRRDINSVILAAEGSKAFSAGADLRAGSETPTTLSELLDPGRAWREMQDTIRRCPVPVIAAVEAPAIGGGFGLVATCDIIYASTNARFGLTEINVGMLGGASKVLRMLGPYKARVMFFSGDLVEPDELYRLGGIERPLEPGMALKAARAMAVKLAEKSPIALRLAKESLLRIEPFDVDAAYRTEQDYTARLRGYRDSAEATAAFLEKRSPHWSWS